ARVPVVATRARWAWRSPGGATRARRAWRSPGGATRARRAWRSPGGATRARRAWRSPGARRFKWFLVLLTLAACPAAAADWGLITPGRTTIDAVRAGYGQPTTIEPKNAHSPDTVPGIHEGAHAPL